MQTNVIHANHTTVVLFTNRTLYQELASSSSSITRMIMIHSGLFKQERTMVGDAAGRAGFSYCCCSWTMIVLNNLPTNNSTRTGEPLYYGSYSQTQEWPPKDNTTTALSTFGK